MFGYVITNCKTLSEEEGLRFRAMYCGMCHVLKERYRQLGRFTLSYDMTFVAMVLSALYEEAEVCGKERCAAHMLKPHAYIVTPAMEYAVDMNIALFYHKCADNWKDDRNPMYAAAKLALAGAYRRVSELHPEKCRCIEEWMREIGEIEVRDGEIDPPMNLTGRMLGELFNWKDDFWAEELRRMGDGLGRFIYFMDAYDDLKRDVRRGKYNPLRRIMNQPDYEQICKGALTMAMADSAEAFEALPVVRDAELIRNILYSGVWARYGYIQQKRAEALEGRKVRRGRPEAGSPEKAD